MPKVKGVYFPIVNFNYHADMMKELGPSAPTVFGLLCLSQKMLYKDSVNSVELLKDGCCKLPLNSFKHFKVTPGSLKKHLEYFKGKGFLDYTLEKSSVVFTIKPHVYPASRSPQPPKSSYMTSVAEEEKQHNKRG